ncbi:hypothetical protein B0H63DRAFT_160301 [Podospora didyma]|uniref:Uncharacterized protein n=1 Tax=Podospora didyma TaxID=330526 RepID=A0AAE0NU43_9PEZI|nr:hypothetical protein B0H63DRAFT_160301 [Podospora didyma]
MHWHLSSASFYKAHIQQMQCSSVGIMPRGERDGRWSRWPTRVEMIVGYLFLRRLHSRTKQPSPTDSLDAVFLPTTLFLPSMSDLPAYLQILVFLPFHPSCLSWGYVGGGRVAQAERGRGKASGPSYTPTGRHIFLFYALGKLLPSPLTHGGYLLTHPHDDVAHQVAMSGFDPDVFGWSLTMERNQVAIVPRQPATQGPASNGLPEQPLFNSRETTMTATTKRIVE